MGKLMGMGGGDPCGVGGGYAEYVAVPAGHILPVPSSFSMAQAGGTMEVGLTAWRDEGVGQSPHLFELGAPSRHG
jgi:NADPH:quinone reductase-like Zn-dependent oxidoreductase